MTDYGIMKAIIEKYDTYEGTRMRKDYGDEEFSDDEELSLVLEDMWECIGVCYRSLGGDRFSEAFREIETNVNAVYNHAKALDPKDLERIPGVNPSDVQGFYERVEVLKRLVDEFYNIMGPVGELYDAVSNVSADIGLFRQDL